MILLTTKTSRVNQGHVLILHMLALPEIYHNESLSEKSIIQTLTGPGMNYVMGENYYKFNASHCNFKSMICF